MPLLDAIILGIIQGLTEFLPISSSGHLLIAHELWGLGAGQSPDQELTFDVALHAGTLTAILIYFWRDIVALIKAALASLRERSLAGDPMRRLSWFILLATIPAAGTGALAENLIEQHLRAPWITAIVLMVFGLLLFWSEKVGRQAKTIRDITLRDALTVGCWQALALIPGVSRSGATITAGLFRDLERDAAARFSFLLGGPVIAGAAAFKLGKLIKTGIPPDEQLAFLAGTLSAAVVGFLAIWFLLRFLRTHTTYVFVLYRILFGLGILIFVFTRGSAPPS